MNTGIQVAAMIVIASFVIDRVTGGTFFLLSLSEAWSRHFPDLATVEDPTEKLQARKRTKLAYYLFVGVLATFFVVKFDISVLKALQLNGYADHPWLDHLFSILVLMGGSDQIATLLNSPHAGKAFEATSASRPIEVTGKLTLEDGAKRLAHPPRPDNN
jgi:hypothetical protein